MMSGIRKLLHAWVYKACPRTVAERQTRLLGDFVRNFMFLILTVIIICFGCNEENSFQNKCFCDKVVQEIVYDSVEYFICTKKSNVYKLEERKSGLVKLTKHNINNLGFCDELIKAQNNITLIEKSDYIKIYCLSDSIKFSFTKSNIDSVKLFLSFNNQITHQFCATGKNIVIKEDILEKNPKHFIKFKAFYKNKNYTELAKYNSELKQSLLKGDTPIIRTAFSYYYKNYNEILSENLDSTLYKILLCKKNLPSLEGR